MSRELNAFEFFEGTRNSTQVLYRNHLFNKHSGITWRCNHMEVLKVSYYAQLFI